MANITLDDLLASESEVLKRIADDLEGESGKGSSMAAGHHSNVNGHRSGSNHNSHSSGMGSASRVPRKDEGG